MVREYAHNAERAGELGVPVGEFTAWQRLRPAATCCFTRPAWRRRVANLDSAQVDARHFPAGFDRRVNARVSMWPNMSTC